MPSFTEILNKPAAQVEKPKPYPVGEYLCIVDGPFQEREVNGTPIVRWKLKPIQPMQSVDQSALAAAGGLGRPMYHDFWMLSSDGQPNDYPLIRFLEEHLGIERGDKSIAQMAAEAPGKQCIVTIKHTVSKDGTEIYGNVASTAKV